MKSRHLPLALCSVVLFIGWLWMAGSTVIAASPSPALVKAKQQAEASGYIFFTSHNDILDHAKKEGKLRVLAGHEPKLIKALVKAFKEKYPFINVYAEEFDGLENYQRLLLELKAGLAKGWDLNYVGFELYNEYLPYQKKFDILGMAQHDVLRISPNLVDPVNRHIISLSTNIQVVAYNNTLISPDRVPATWEGFLKPEFKDRKFVLDVRPKLLGALVPAWGLEKTLEYSRKLAAQNPIWLRGETRSITYLLAGENALVLGPNYKAFVRAQAKDPKKVLGHKVVSPVPTRLSHFYGVLTTAENPHAALLWLEFMGGPEAQKIVDDLDLAASIYTPGSFHEKASRGEKISLLAWQHFQKIDEYDKEIVKALGFPKAETK
ncbi:MAG: ABC transporter substrate-binding protein [Deltaproteobacteria bacterium]|nr:ABC transporter substrate-binding protein [Deltaproteobacteria bacterium]